MVLKHWKLGGRVLNLKLIVNKSPDNKNGKLRRQGAMIKADGSQPRGREFEPRNWILDGSWLLSVFTQHNPSCNPWMTLIKSIGLGGKQNEKKIASFFFASNNSIFEIREQQNWGLCYRALLIGFLFLFQKGNQIHFSTDPNPTIENKKK